MFFKSKLMVGLSVAVAFGMVACEKKLDSDQKKASYAIGQQIGGNMKQQNIDIDTDVMAMAMKDAIKGDSKLTPEKRLSWAQRQTYLALGNAVNGATALSANRSSPIRRSRSLACAGGMWR